MAGAQADIHTKILTASTTEELMGIYDNWAQGYETQLLDEWGYTSPQTAVKLLASAMQLDGVHVLDATCPHPGCNLRIGQGAYEALGFSDMAAAYRRCIGGCRRCPARHSRRVDLERPLPERGGELLVLGRARAAWHAAGACRGRAGPPWRPST